MLRLDRFVLALAFVGLLLSGCRTYGGYDSEAKTYQAMQRSVEAFADELDRAEAELQTLADAAKESDTLQSLVHDYEGALEEHRALLETQRRRLERLSASSGYREIQRAYGATVTEQRMMEQNYRRLVRAVRVTVQGTGLDLPPPQEEQQYTIRPANFPSLRTGERLSMEQVLRGL